MRIHQEYVRIRIEYWRVNDPSRRVKDLISGAGAGGVLYSVQLYTVPHSVQRRG